MIIGEVVSVDLSPAVRLGDHQISASTAERIQRAPSENTRRAYAPWISAWRAWCSKVDRTPFPATGETLAEFVSMLADAGKGSPTIRIAIAAVRAQHAVLGHDEQPPLRLAKMALRTHTRDRVDDGARGKRATPIVLDALQRMVATLDLDTLRGRRDQLVLVLGWAGMLRRSELAALQSADVTVAQDGVSIFIARSKTDKDARGATVIAPVGVHPDTDPVRVLLAYRAAMGDAGIEGGRLIREICLGGRITAGITGHGINDLVKQAALRAGLPDADKYSAHSLRAGGATASYLAGTPVDTIAAHGRWAPNSPVVLGYIRAVDQRRNNAMRKVGL